MSKIIEKLPFLLTRVERPGRYTGNEINVIHKSWEEAACRVCLVYPDAYEIGMPFIGYQILYHILNVSRGILAERAFAPWTDMEKLLREHEVPLFSLESKHALSDFDLVGFTLQYEMTYTNILNILDLGHIPVLSSGRGEQDPIIMGGGSCAFNPEPLADIIDVFVIGDGEEITPKLAEIVAGLRLKGASRETILRACNLPGEGVYVPSYYDQETQGFVKSAKIASLSSKNYSTRPIIPLIEISQDRFALEIQRGCGAGCRFCHAGIIYRPVREREPEELVSQANETLKNTGYEEISLLSLSTSDYSRLGELVNDIAPVCEENNIAISFPSLRLDSFNIDILEAAGRRKRSGLTFAPEAGTQRLRNVINKNISEEDIYSSVRLAFEHKWNTLKFYFMVGLPTETDEDLQGIVNMVRRIYGIAREYSHSQINVTLSSFIPKAHTPFQWAEHVSPEELNRRIYFIRDQLHLPALKIMHRDPEFSVYESILSRGDRSAGKILYKAWKNGASFDAWSEMFNRSAWDKAMGPIVKNIEDLIGKRDVNVPQPWSFIHTGVDERFLKEEKEKAERGETTEDCRLFCSSCGLCDAEIGMLIADEKDIAKNHKIQEGQTEEEPTQPAEYYTLRIEYEKTDMMRYIGHHDLLRVIQRVCNILRWPVRYSRGYNRRPRISAGYPVPMGFDARRETMDILLNEKVDNPREALNSILPEGIRIHKAECAPGKRTSIMEHTKELLYVFHFRETINESAIRQRIEEFMARDTCLLERKHKKGTKKIDLKPFIKYWELDNEKLSVCYKVINSQTGRPDEFLKLAFGENIPYFIGERKHVIIKD